MAQTYTLEEAAGRLSISPDEFKRRLKDDWKQIRSFRDGATLRFRAADIDELARMMGEQSDPGLQLGPVGAGAATEGDSSDDFLLSPDPPSGGGPKSKLIRPSDIATDPDTHLPAADSGSKVGRSKVNLKPPSDSDIRVEPPAGGRASDPANATPTEEIALDLSGPGSAIIKPSGLSGKLPSPKSSGGKSSGGKSSGGKSSGKLAPPSSSKKLSSPSSSARIPGPASGRVNPADGSSEFELSLDADSDSFELQIGDDSNPSAESLEGLELGPPSEDRGGLSGINLGKPADSGLSLEKRPPGSKPSPLGGPKSSKIMPKSGPKSSRKAPQDESDIDFELSLDAGGLSGTRLGGPKSGKMSMDSSDSEFELTLDDEGAGASDAGGPKTAAGSATAKKGDIFETDFDLPSVEEESGSEVVELPDESNIESNSDFDLAISEGDVPSPDDPSGSEVVLMDDAPLIDEDGGEVLIDEGSADVAVDELPPEEEPASASGALRGVRHDEDEEEEAGPVRTVPAAPARWGALPAVVLLATLPLMFVGTLMSFELLRSMWGYHQTSPPGNLIAPSLAGMFGMKVAE